MPTAPHLRQAGPERLVELFTRRPDVLDPVPPRSMAELVARLDHPHSLSLALTRLPLPALEVAEALAALGPAADLPALRRLIGLDRPGITPGADDAPDADDLLGRELDRLCGYGLSTPAGAALDPALQRGWPTPLGLAVVLAEVLPQLPAETLGRALTTWQVRKPSLRKADLVAAVGAVLGDAARVRAAVAAAPAATREHLDSAAYGRRFVIPLGYGTYYRSGPVPADLTWARDRLLLVSGPGPWLVMPDVVAMALRGPDWHATFTPQPPPAFWRPVPEPDFTQAGTAAALQALQLFGDVLRELDRSPLRRRKDGFVGARELRRLAKGAQLDAEWLPLVLSVAEVAGLVENGTELELSERGRSWLDLDPPPALTILLEGWRTMPGVIGRSDEELTWPPDHRVGAQDLRRVVLEVLADHPGQAPTGQSLYETVAWRAPILLGRGLNGPLEGAPKTHQDGTEAPGDVLPDSIDPDTDPTSGPGSQPSRTLGDVIVEAVFLGLVAADALTPIGRALLAPEGPAAVLRAAQEGLTPAQDEIVLQADLTATVLGQPSGRLITLLDGMADRESRSMATTWRFTPASIRRALDTGDTGPELLADLSAVGRGAVPQPLTYLITDVARQHGRLRAGTATSYLRCDDAALLAEVAVDRKLSKHGLRLLAPTVLICASPLPVLIEALRVCGYGPVQEAADGSAVLSRRRGGRADSGRAGSGQTDSGRESGAPGRGPTTADRPAIEVRTSPGLDLLDVATRILTAPDRPRQLMNIGQTIVDIDSLTAYRDAQDQPT